MTARVERKLRVRWWASSAAGDGLARLDVGRHVGAAKAVDRLLGIADQIERAAPARSSKIVRKISHCTGSVSWNSSMIASRKRCRSVAVSSLPRGPRAPRRPASACRRSRRARRPACAPPAARRRAGRTAAPPPSRAESRRRRARRARRRPARVRRPSRSLTNASRSSFPDRQIEGAPGTPRVAVALEAARGRVERAQPRAHRLGRRPVHPGRARLQLGWRERARRRLAAAAMRSGSNGVPHRARSWCAR